MSKKQRGHLEALPSRASHFFWYISWKRNADKGFNGECTRKKNWRKKKLISLASLHFNEKFGTTLLSEHVQKKSLKGPQDWACFLRRKMNNKLFSKPSNAYFLVDIHTFFQTSMGDSLCEIFKGIPYVKFSRTYITIWYCRLLYISHIIVTYFPILCPTALYQSLSLMDFSNSSSVAYFAFSSCALWAKKHWCTIGKWFSQWIQNRSE